MLAGKSYHAKVTLEEALAVLTFRIRHRKRLAVLSILDMS